MLTAAPASVSERFAEALRPGVMGPRLAAAPGGMPGACHVLDAKFEPGVRAVLLYEQAGRCCAATWCPTAAGPVPIRPGWSRPECSSRPSRTTRSCRLCRASWTPPAWAAPWRRRCRRPEPDPWLARSAVPHRGCCATARASASPSGSPRGPRPRPTWPRPTTSPRKAAAVAEEAPVLQARRPAGGTLSVRAASSAHRPRPGPGGAAASGGVPARGAPAARPAAAAPGTAAGPGPRGPGARRAARDAAVPTGAQRPVEAELVRFGERALPASPASTRVLGRAGAGLAERLMTTQDQLPAAHTGVVHGDCKPSQFLLDSSAARAAGPRPRGRLGPGRRRRHLPGVAAPARVRARPGDGGPGRPSPSSASLAELFLAATWPARGTCRELSRIAGRRRSRSSARPCGPSHGHRAPRWPTALVVEAHACLDQAVEAS